MATPINTRATKNCKVARGIRYDIFAPKKAPNTDPIPKKSPII